MHVITAENYEEAQDAVRDILMLYVDLADSTEGFGHGADVYVRFDPLRFVDAEGDGTPIYYVDLDLLRAGSAVAVVCAFYDLWSEEQNLQGHPLAERYEAALEEGKLSAFPDIEEVLRSAISRDRMPLDDPWFEQAVVPIYRKYVLGLFRRLAASDRYAATI
jgi:hypothetical protein